jgi:hypothetical protein
MIQLGEEIGRGGYGIVYVKDGYPGKCVKVSNKGLGGCRVWSNEYKKIRSFMDLIVDNKAYKKLDNFLIQKVYRWKIQ